MSQRLIELILPKGYLNVVKEILQKMDVSDYWETTLDDSRLHIKILVPTKNTENILDQLEKHFAHMEGFRIILLSVEASLPRPKQDEKKQPERSEISEGNKRVSKWIRVSREELYSDIEKMVSQSWVFIAMMLFSSVVASIGILRNSVVFIIGAMVIAPLLGLNVALSFATTIGDVGLARRAIKAIGIGILTAFISSLLVGMLVEMNPETPGLLMRTEVSMGDVIVALVAGSAAALSFTSEMFGALIGVMVAVALLPPLVTMGLLGGAGRWTLAIGSLFLFLINLICVNLAGVVMFLIQGIRPITWWEATRAKKATRLAIYFWMTLLIALVLMIFLSKKG